MWGEGVTVHQRHARLYAEACESTPFFERYGIRVLVASKTWMAGSSPAMTTERLHFQTTRKPAKRPEIKGK
jgi:hypothetical protein